MHASGHETPEARDLYASALDVTWERARRGDDRGTGATVRVSIRSFGGGAGWRREVEARRWMRGRGGAGAEARRRRGGDRARARSRARFESLTNRGRAGGREHAPPCRGRRWRERRRGRRGSYRVRRWRASSSSLDALTPQSGSLRKWREAATWTSWQPEEPNVNVIRSEATTGIYHFYQTARHTSTDGTRLARSSSRILRRVFITGIGNLAATLSDSMSLASAPPPRVTARARVRPRGIAVRASSSSSSTDGADLSRRDLLSSGASVAPHVRRATPSGRGVHLATRVVPPSPRR